MPIAQLDNLQHFKARYREIIAAAVASKADHVPELRTGLAALIQDIEASSSEAECAAFAEFVMREAALSSKRLAKRRRHLAKRETQLANSLAALDKRSREMLNNLNIRLFWGSITD